MSVRVPIVRRSEALVLEWTCLDLEPGTIVLDENKTDDPRTWALGSDVVAALKAWHDRFHPDADKKDRVFVDRNGWAYQSERAAQRFRRHLEQAGVDREKLFEKTSSRIPVRVQEQRSSPSRLQTVAPKPGSPIARVTSRA